MNAFDKIEKLENAMCDLGCAIDTIAMHNGESADCKNHLSTDIAAAVEKAEALIKILRNLKGGAA